jgi:hypothetical protein
MIRPRPLAPSTSPALFTSPTGDHRTRSMRVQGTSASFASPQSLQADMFRSNVKSDPQSSSSRATGRPSNSSGAQFVDYSDNGALFRQVREIRLGSSPRRPTSDPSRDRYSPPSSPRTYLTPREVEAQAVANSHAASRALRYNRASPPNALLSALSSAPTVTKTAKPDPWAHTARLAIPPGADPMQALDEWLSGPSDEALVLPLPDHARPSGQPSFARGWRRPKFVPGPAFEEHQARDRMKPPKHGGRSKAEQLGSVTDSWGAFQEVNGAKPLGIFEIEPDPPSRNTSPFKTAEAEAEQIDMARQEALERARAGMSIGHENPYSHTSGEDAYSPRRSNTPGMIRSSIDIPSTLSTPCPARTGHIHDPLLAFARRHASSSTAPLRDLELRRSETPRSDVFGPTSQIARGRKAQGV